MFDRFTDRAKKVMSLAHDEAKQLQYAHVGPEHILLGILSEGTGVAANVLMNRGLTFDRIRATAIGNMTDRGPATEADDVPFSTATKLVLESARHEAAGLAHSYIGTEHLLLGLLRVTDCIAAKTLHDLDTDLEQARADVVEFCGGPAKPTQPADPTIDRDSLRRAAIEAMKRHRDG